MAAVTPSSDQAADLLKNLSLNSEAKSIVIQDPAPKGTVGDNGPIMYQEVYMPVKTYHSMNSPVPTMGYDGQLYGTQHYQYPGSFYQPQTPTSTIYSQNQASRFSQGDVPTSKAAENLSLRGGTARGNPDNIVNAGAVNRNSGQKPFRPSNQHSSSELNGSYKRQGLPTGFPSSGYIDPRFGYDGFQSPYPWLDASFTNGSSANAVGGGFTSQLNSHPTRPTSGLTQASGFTNLMYPSNKMYDQYGNGAGTAYGSFGYNSWTNGRGWVVDDNTYKPKARVYGNENMDGLSELNRGPRAKGFKNQEVGPTTQAVEMQNFQLAKNTKEDNLSQILDKEQYNREDFPEDYSDAKFFVIKSYSEDDVHKSIKYGVWASTPNGNKKLDTAYNEAKGYPNGCPVFLLFSVNTSGQFVGLAEMVGPVDFDQTVEYWQQDKWNGCFPVKWHIIKDVPNGTLRHIILENNENKPVTNSRDTQEVIFEKGIQILKIFKCHIGKTSILDDFGFYAARERIMREKRVKRKTQKQVLDGRGASDDASDDTKTAATIGKGSLTKSMDATPMKETAGASAVEPGKNNGEVKHENENGSRAAAGNSSDDAKSDVSSEKKVVPNVVASAC